MRILVLGGYGLIGLGVVRRLIADGHEAVGAGRSPERGRALLPQAEWLALDLHRCTDAGIWRPVLAGADAVVNCAGALQDGLKDNLTRVQREAIVALIRACETEGVKTFVHISAPGASPEADTDFLRTKSEADEALRQSRLAWTIFKPGLVLAPTAYGGTSLLRMLAGFPFVQPIIFAKVPVQTVGLDDVAEAVSMSVGGAFAGKEFDLVEEEPHALEDLVAAMRGWLGFGRARLVLRLPKFLGYMLAKGADLAGWLGWRSALRTTSLKVLENGVTGDPGPWADASGLTAAPLHETLARLPSTVQERVYARAQLAFPVMLLTLAGFWIGSGAVGLWSLDAASRHLTGDLSPSAARLAVTGASVIDMTIGAAMLVRGSVRPACFAALLLSAVYLVTGSMTAPELWADPFGPLVKIFPGMALALGVAALAEER